MGEPTLFEMATYIKKYADVKFQMNVSNLDQNNQGQNTLDDFKAEAMKMYGKDKP